MTEVDVLEIAREAVFVLLKVIAPLLVTGMVVGLAISLFQTLTSLQEMTLVFVPKILAVFTALILSLPFIMNELLIFTHGLFDRMVALG